MSKAAPAPEPATITPPPALGPPIIGTDPGSIPGIPQPVFAGGSATSPATPISITGTPLLPPPQVGLGGGVLVGPAISPAPVPPSTAGFPQPQYATGSGAAPTAASLFPAFTAAGPSPPIVINTAQNVTSPPSPPGAPPAWVPPPALPLPTTPGTSPIPVVLNGWGLYAGPAPATPWPFGALMDAINVNVKVTVAKADDDEDNDDDDDEDDDGPIRKPTPGHVKPKAKPKAKPHGRHRY